jgi:hypothetical protein
MISDSNKYAKKSQIVHIKQINGKINKENSFFYLLRSGGQPRLPDRYFVDKIFV